MTMRSIFTTSLLLVLVSGYSQHMQDVSFRNLKKHTEFLASDSLKGRKPGTPEIEVAAKYILGQFRSAGLIPMGEEGMQYFEIVTDVTTGPDNFLKVGGLEGRLFTDFTPVAFSSTGRVEGKLVFAGFGFDAEFDTLRWNDYASIDAAGKWIMVFRGDPEPDNSDSRFIPISNIRTKVLTARDKGAAGVLLVTPKSLEKDDKLMTLQAENNEVTAGIPVINIRREFADRMLGRSGFCDSIEKIIIKGKTPQSFETGVVLGGGAEVNFTKERTANVVAYIPGSDPLLSDEFLVAGAHYDHLGMGGPGSGSRMPDTTAVHNGADDNASGVAMIIELARVLAMEKERLKRSIIFVAFSAEEMGLIGSKFFVNNPPAELKKIRAMFNFDMVGRFDKEKNAISISGTGTSAEGDSVLRLLESGLPFMVTHSPDGYGPSDHAAFYSAGIPVFYFNTGVHTDYHTPFDDIEKLDFRSQAAIGDFAADVILKIADMDEGLTFRESGKKDGSGRYGRRLKVTLGIMPDFAGSETKGLRVDGVTKDGPAYKGGMLKGDIIISINGLRVENIYEYMSRLQKLQLGQTIMVEVVRDKKNQVLLIQL